MAVLIDTSIYYALLDPDDMYHFDAVSLIYHILKGRYGRPYTIDYVIVETTLLLKARNLAYKIPLFIEFLQKENIRIICVDDEILSKSIKILTRKPETSLTDIAQVIIANNMRIKYMASLDEWFKQQGLIVLGKNYTNTLSEKELAEIKNYLRSIKKNSFTH